MPAENSLVPEKLFDGEEIEVLKRRERAQVALDTISRKFGKGVLTVASAKVSENWRMKRDLLSPCCTTRWDELLKVS